jgi:hypothetical protein
MLSDDDVRQVHALYAEGWSEGRIAEGLGVSRFVVHRALYRESQAKPPRPDPPPRNDWGPQRGIRDVGDLVPVPELAPIVPELAPPPVMPRVIDEPWGSPHAAGRRAEDDQAEDFVEPQPEPAPPETGPQPYRWKEPKRKTRAWIDE